MSNLKALAVSAYRGTVTDKTFSTIDRMYSIGKKLDQSLSAINADRTRTDTERLPLRNKAAKAAKAEFDSLFTPALAEAVTKAESLERDKSCDLIVGLDNVVIAQLATMLMSKNPTEIQKLAAADMRFTRALNMFPAEAFGIDATMHKNTIDRSWRALNPEKAEAMDAATRDVDVLMSFKATVSDSFINTAIEQTEHGMKAAGRVEV